MSKRAVSTVNICAGCKKTLRSHPDPRADEKLTCGIKCFIRMMRRRGVSPAECHRVERELEASESACKLAGKEFKEFQIEYTLDDAVS